MTGWSTAQEILELWVDTETHDDGPAAEEPRGPATAASDVAARTAGGDGPGRPVAGREAVPRSVHGMDREILCSQASYVSKPASNLVEEEKGWRRVGRTLEGGRGGEEVGTNAAVHGRRRLVKWLVN